MCPIWISENTTAVSLDGDFVICSLGPLDDGTRIDIDSCSEDAIEFMLGEIMFGDFCRILLVSYSSVGPNMRDSPMFLVFSTFPLSSHN